MADIDPGIDLTYGRKPAQVDPAHLIQSHMPLVRKIAWHVHGRISSASEIEDLMQIGMIALVESANGFEDRGHAFATYASVRIRGAMIDHLRRQASLCRSAMAKRKELAGVRQRLTTRLGRVPTEQEMGEEMGLQPSEFRELVDDTQAIQHESIDEMYSDQSMWFADIDDRADETLEREQLAEAIAATIQTLPEREAMVLQLYFVEEMNLEEIGQTLGVGAARVCQIKKSALDKVRAELAEWAN